MSEPRQDARSQLTDLKRRLVVMIADEQRLYQHHLEAAREAERWKRRAELALGRGIDDLSRAALERSNKHAAESERYRQHYLEQKGHVERMKSRLLALEIRARAGVTLSALPDTAAVERNLAYLDRFDERAREERARLAAQAELERDELAEKLAAMEREDRLERQLAELKRRYQAQGTSDKETGRQGDGETG